MARYESRPVSRIVEDYGDDYEDWDNTGKTTEIFDSGFGEDRPTGIYDASGNMIWCLGRRIGFSADHT